MKRLREILFRGLQIYMLVWLLSAILIYPVRVESTVNVERADKKEGPVQVLRSICVAPTLFLVDWQEGEGAFVSSGWQGLMCCSPWHIRLITYRMTWIS